MGPQLLRGAGWPIWVFGALVVGVFDINIPPRHSHQNPGLHQPLNINHRVVWCVPYGADLPLRLDLDFFPPPTAAGYQPKLNGANSGAL